MISIAKQELPEEAVKELLNRLSDDRWVMGEAVREFEERFAEYVGADYAVAMCNGTMALLAAYEALGVRGRGLVTTPYTFVATAAAATFLGSSVDFVDVLPEDACIDPARAIERARGAVVCAVHIFGYPARVDAIVEGTDAPVVEDCAQAHGARLRGRRVGSYGDAAVFSFYPSKNMTVAGDGGMLVTSDERVYRRALMLRDNGRVSRYVHAIAGLNLRLNTINAAVGLVELRYLDEWNEVRRRHARLYHDLLRDLSEHLELGSLPTSDREPVYNTYPIKVRRAEHRGALGAWLEAHGVRAAVYYPLPLHRQPLYEGRFRGVSFPVAEDWSRRVLNLPCHQFLSEGEVRYVASLVREFFEQEVYREREWRRKGAEWEESAR